MAHLNITEGMQGNYEQIYEDIIDITKKDDLTFANLESPVMDSRNFQNYPNFNVKKSFALAAVDAGIDVFSLANNHTNDQGLEGIYSTRDFFKSMEAKKITACGIKSNKNEKITYRLIKKNGFKILFAAITEFSNDNKFLDEFDYWPSDKNSRNQLCKILTQLRQEHPCDIFILSVHNDDEEYARNITERRRIFFHELANCGVDVVWSNHPHVAKNWEILRSKKNSEKASVIIYSLGNLISGQRIKRNYAQPDSMREYTGESIILQINFVKNSGSAMFKDAKMIILTNYTETAGKRRTYIKKLTPEFINSLSEKERQYFSKRSELMKDVKETTIWL